MTKPAKKLLALSLSSLGSLLLLEIVLRAFVPVPRVFHFDLDTIEFTQGTPPHLLEPNSVSIMSDGYFREEVRIDRFGHRDLYDDSKAPGLLAFGDSQTFGHGVAVTDNWPEILQSQLDVNVVNVGIWGYGLPDYLALMPQWLDELEFETAIYGMTFNDFFSALPSGSAGSAEKARGALRWMRAPTTWLRRFTAIGIATSSAINNVLSRIGVKSASIPLDSTSRTATDAIHALNRMLREHGKSLAIVYLSNPNHVRPDVWALMQRRTNHGNRTFPDLLRSELDPTIGFIDATPALEARYLESGSQRRSLMLEADPHYNRGGHEVIAGETLKLIRGEARGGR